jgi:hypothetical protein
MSYFDLPAPITVGRNEDILVYFRFDKGGDVHDLRLIVDKQTVVVPVPPPLGKSGLVRTTNRLDRRAAASRERRQRS